MVSYDLRRSRRKTVGIYIKDGRVEVRAPFRATLREIEKFVASKDAWINEKLLKSIDRLEARGAFELNYGDSVICRGASYRIAAREGARAGFDGAEFYMPPGMPPWRIKSCCVQIYRMIAKRDLPGRVSRHARAMGVSPASVGVSGAKTRWGSCSSRKSLNFSWRLIIADDEVIDYVVVHELAHLKEMNHSERFWAIVEGALPDCRARKARLRALQKRLSLENWD